MMPYILTLFLSEWTHLHFSNSAALQWCFLELEKYLLEYVGVQHKTL